MNNFFNDVQNGETRFPNQVYARLDQSEPQASGSDLLIFDAIDAAAIDSIPNVARARAIGANSPVDSATLCAVTIEAVDLGSPAPHSDDSESENVGWFKFKLDYASGGPALVYPNLEGIGRPAYVRDFKPLPDNRSKDLESMFSLDAYTTTESEIDRELSGRPSIEDLTVYDVGQGNAVGLNARHFPFLYFDFGGGVLKHASTFPPALTAFCFTAQPLIVLSHWDWDHWSAISVKRSPVALGMTWIAPLQKIGPIHASFAKSIKNLLIWPPALSAASNPANTLEVLKCTGSGRNHSGLALEVRNPATTSDDILLPGDARYSAIPGALTKKYSSIVVPHHGADMRSSAVPAPLGQPSGRLVYSCAGTNSFGHPRSVTKQNHAAQGWLHGSSLATNNARYTYHRWPYGLGHTGIGWSNGLKGRSMPCGTTLMTTAGCALAAHQD